MIIIISMFIVYSMFSINKTKKILIYSMLYVCQQSQSLPSEANLILVPQDVVDPREI